MASYAAPIRHGTRKTLQGMLSCDSIAGARLHTLRGGEVGERMKSDRKDCIGGGGGAGRGSRVTIKMNTCVSRGQTFATQLVHTLVIIARYVASVQHRQIFDSSRYTML